MRADRLLSIVWLLQSRGRLSANALAARLEVTPRTIQRDVEALSTAGVPVIAVRGRDGGFELLPGYRPAVTALTPQESLALFAGISAASADTLGMGASFAAAMRKTLAAVPEPSRPAAVNLSDRIVIDPEGWLPTTQVKIHAVLQDAVLRDRKVQFRYRSKNQKDPSPRTVDPYGLVNSAGSWYLVGSHRGVVKFFRATRVRNPEVLEVDAIRPAQLDLAALWRQHRESFRSRLVPIEVRAFIHPHALERVADRALESTETGEATIINHETWPELRLTFGDLHHTITVLLALSSDVYVLEPIEVRRAILDRASAILAVYR